MSDENEGHGSKIVWCFGERSTFAHAYPGEAGLAAGVALCGTKCIPMTEFVHWDLSREEIRNITCPVCLKLLAAAEYARPLDRKTDADALNHC